AEWHDAARDGLPAGCRQHVWRHLQATAKHIPCGSPVLPKTVFQTRSEIKIGAWLSSEAAGCHFAQSPVQPHDHDPCAIDQEEPDIGRCQLSEGRCVYFRVQFRLKDKPLRADVLRCVALGEIALKPYLFRSRTANPGFGEFDERP